MVSDECFAITIDLRKVYDNLQRAILQTYERPELDKMWIDNVEHNIRTVEARGQITKDVQDGWLVRTQTALRRFTDDKNARQFDATVTDLADEIYRKIIDISVDCEKKRCE